jgi:hypothetical protein
MASLVLGMDFYEKEVYVGLWNEEERCTKSFNVPAKSDGEHIPLFVVPTGKETFIAGHEGIAYSIREGCNGVSLLYGKNVKERVEVNGMVFEISELLAGFIGDILSAVRKCYAGAAFSRICITGERMNPDDSRRLSDALLRLGYGKERFFIINHANAFLRYMVSSDEIRRRQRAVTIDTDSFGSEVYFYNPADRGMGFPTYIERLETSPVLNEELYTIADGDKRKEAFEDVVSYVMTQDRNVNCLYVTGHIAEDERIKDVLRRYASASLKIFSGQNLYSSGACYRAVDEKLKDGILSDGEVFHTVSVEAYKDAVIDGIPLIKAGCPLDRAVGRIYLIPDNSDKIVFRIRDQRTGRSEAVNFPLDGLIHRENRTNRLEITVRFPDIKTLVIKVRDLGFGSIYPASYRVSEQTIML